VRRAGGLLLALLLCASARAGADQGLVAHWDFAEGSGGVLHDRAGNGNDGAIHGAAWVKTDRGHALKFGRTGSYVAFGDNPKLKLTRDFSFCAWIEPTADLYPDSTTNWHIFSWEAYRKSGAGFRIAGSSAQLFFRSNQFQPAQASDPIQQGLSEIRLANKTFYHVVLVKKGKMVTFFVDGMADAEFPVQDPLPNDLPFTLSLEEQSFAGLMDDVRMYNRAISAAEVVALYGEGGTRHGKDVSWIGKMKLTPFIYYDDAKATAEADVRGVLPLKTGERIVVELRQAGRPPLESRERATAPASGKEDFKFDLGKLAPGAYEVNAAIRAQGKARAEAAFQFDYPQRPPSLPSPAERLVGALPPAPKAPAYTIEVGKSGGFLLRMGSASYPVESAYTYPHGGENRLAASGRPAGGEKQWTVQTERTGDSTYRVVAQGRYYRITRELEVQPTRVLVKDRIENLTGEDLGLALDNRIDATGMPGADLQAPAAPTPPAFLREGDHGAGLVPLNDVYQLLQRTYIAGRVCGLKIAGLGIPKNGAHALEWAVYPIGTADFYDFINTVRKDEHLNGVTVDGVLALSQAGQWLKDPPPDELVRFGGIRYAAAGGLPHSEDDPGITIEGIEFVRAPQEREMLRRNYAETRKRYPDLKVGFHVAWNIYATHQPEKLFTDSRVIAASGKHEMYGNDGAWFSQERRAQGWAWYPYYATLTNSFGQELLKSADVMMDDIGANMVWADGLLDGYGSASGDYPTSFVSTLGPWDGYTVELDPATKTISRKWGQIVGLGKEALLEYIRRINAKGGRVWINHGTVVPRTFARQEVYWAAETADGDQHCASLLLAPAPHGLANPSKFATVQMIYDDVRAKLSWGVLYAYFWSYGASQLTHRMITADMYPITVEEVHSGCIKGRERIITMRPGVYGWREDHHLHAVRLYDARGRMIAHSFMTTADAAGTRTLLELTEGQTAILVRLPILVNAQQPVNLCVTRSESDGLDLAMNGQGTATLQLEEPGAIRVSGASATVDAELRTVALTLNGPVQVQIRRGER
jgi:hypothetical protein